MKVVDRSLLELDLMSGIPDSLNKNFWLQDQLKKANAQLSDLHPLFNEAFTSVFLAEELDVVAEYGSVEFWKKLCIAMMKAYLPACKTKSTGGRHSTPPNEKKLLIGRLERIAAHYDKRIYGAARILSKSGVDKRKATTLRSNHSTWLGQLSTQLIKLHSGNEKRVSDEEARKSLIRAAIELAIEVDGTDPDYLKKNGQ